MKKFILIIFILPITLFVYGNNIQNTKLSQRRILSCDFQESYDKAYEALSDSKYIFYPMRIIVGSSCGLTYRSTIDCDGSCNEAAIIEDLASYYLELECARITHYV